MITTTLTRAWRKVLHPFAQVPLLQTYLYSPLDAVAERMSFPTADAFCAQSVGAVRIADHLARFFDDPEATRCLRKDFLRIIEHRLRAVALHADPPEHYGYGPIEFGGLGHPLDPWAAEILSRETDRHIQGAPLPGAYTKALVALLAWGLSLIGVAVFQWLWRGRRRVSPRVARVAGPNFLAPSLVSRLREACIAQGVWVDDALLFVREYDMPPLRFGSLVNVKHLSVPRREWWQRVVKPSLRLTAAVWITGWRHGRDPRTLELATRALNLAATSLPIWRLAMNIRCRWYLDISDYSSHHNLRAIIFRKYGTGLVRWPYTETEGPGLSYRYLDYAAFLSGGTYHHRTYGASWSPGCRAMPVSLMRNDQGFNAHEDLLTTVEVRARIEARLAAGQRMMVFFANNELPGFNEAALTLFSAIWPLVRDHEDWFLVIKPKKPKSAGGFFDLLYKDTRFSGLNAARNVIVSDFPDPATGKTTPPAWLIDRMALGLTLPSTVQAEALTRDRPCVAFFPIIQDTPLTAALKENGLAETDPSVLRRSIERFMRGEPTIRVPIDWARATWDPFADGRALDRIVDFLYADDAGTARRDTSLREAKTTSIPRDDGVTPLLNPSLVETHDRP